MIVRAARSLLLCAALAHGIQPVAVRTEWSSQESLVRSVSCPPYVRRACGLIAAHSFADCGVGRRGPQRCIRGLTAPAVHLRGHGQESYAGIWLKFQARAPQSSSQSRPLSRRLQSVLPPKCNLRTCMLQESPQTVHLEWRILYNSHSQASEIEAAVFFLDLSLSPSSRPSLGYLIHSHQQHDFVGRLGAPAARRGPLRESKHHHHWCRVRDYRPWYPGSHYSSLGSDVQDRSWHGP